MRGPETPPSPSPPPNKTHQTKKSAQHTAQVLVLHYTPSLFVYTLFLFWRKDLSLSLSLCFSRTYNKGCVTDKEGVGGWVGG